MRTDGGQSGGGGGGGGGTIKWNNIASFAFAKKIR